LCLLFENLFNLLLFNPILAHSLSPQIRGASTRLVNIWMAVVLL